MIDKKEFKKDLNQMKENCDKQPDYSPEKDIAYLMAKHNLSRKIIWSKVLEFLNLPKW